MEGQGPIDRKSVVLTKRERMFLAKATEHVNLSDIARDLGCTQQRASALAEQVRPKLVNA